MKCIVDLIGSLVPLYIAGGILFAILAIIIGFAIYKKAYFNSVKFLSMQYDMASVADHQITTIEMIQHLTKSTYANFTPTAQQQMELQSYRTGAMEQNALLPKHTYLCTSPMLKELKKSKHMTLVTYCGFSLAPGTLEHVDEMVRQATEIEQRIADFDQMSKDRTKTIRSEVPILVRLLFKKTLRQKLKMDFKQSWKDMYARYTFQDLSKSSRRMTIALTPQELVKFRGFLETRIDRKSIEPNFQKNN